jgi:hypothetical protein
MLHHFSRRVCLAVFQMFLPCCFLVDIK